ncbi:MAG TPA: sulfotransferase family protein [Comamonadaceae bacterium]|uniref:sulfotransferase family protein n=1 Tax=Pulveribacter sp. TaxID=2678893 RepID=UPI000ECDE127|nr:sulfotransferase [Pulveribacter sp.]HCL87313.1 sulfotransferase family protein [Comamonadaceae bacterium]
MRYHFITGLPRSGSTLLSALLLQNPRFHAGMTSPVGSLFRGMINQLGAGSEFGPVVSREQRRRLVRGLFDSYYADQPGKDVVFDTNRMWSAHLPVLMDLFPGAKLIACVRNVAWVMDSIERRYRANPYETTRLFNDDTERNTVYSRVDTLAQRNRMVGYPWAALKEAFFGEHAASLLVVDYDLLAGAPGKVLPLVYEFLGEPEFTHDFADVRYDAPDFDEALGLHGLHKVRAQVAPQPRQTILPPDLFEQYSKLSFWQDQTHSRASVITAKNHQKQ